jgi:hypothetical protein
MMEERSKQKERGREVNRRRKIGKKEVHHRKFEIF